jgi:RNA polymerase sigma-70 factor (ECF subfamily)
MRRRPTRADLLARLGRITEALASYDEAIALTANQTERAFLQRRRSSLRPGPATPPRRREITQDGG